MSMGPLLGIPGKLKTALDRLTSGRASNLSNLNATISSRASSTEAAKASDYTAPRAAFLDNASVALTSLNDSTVVGKEFPASTTWTRPPTTDMIWVTAIGSGGGGGSKYSLAGGVAGTPGSSIFNIPQEVAGPQPVTIAAGGAGGGPGSPTGGSPGAYGSTSKIGNIGGIGGVAGVVGTVGPGPGPGRAGQWAWGGDHGGSGDSGAATGDGGPASYGGAAVFGRYGGTAVPGPYAPGAGSGSASTWRSHGAPGNPGVIDGTDGGANTGVGGGGGGPYGGDGGTGYVGIFYFE